MIYEKIYNIKQILLDYKLKITIEFYWSDLGILYL